jgi:hypothetical protein
MTRKERRERIIKEIRETYDAVAKEELSERSEATARRPEIAIRGDHGQCA